MMSRGRKNIRLLRQGKEKARVTILRFWDIFRWFPRRVCRLWSHLARKPREAGSFVTDLVFFVADVFGVMEWYETIADWVKWKTRRLTMAEKEVGQSVFGESLHWERIRIDEHARMGTQGGSLCYVSGYTINLWGSMNPALLVHELMHVWQFHHKGLVYIPRALRGYHSEEGYNYGGAEALRALKRKNKTLEHLNYEQQGEVVADYYRLTIGQPPQWGFAGLADLSLYEYFIQPLRAKSQWNI